MIPSPDAPPTKRYPGPVSAGMLEELGRYVVAEPQPFCVDLAASEGMTLATVDGQRLFDWAGYYGSKLLGHNHPGLAEPDYVSRLVLAANNKVANPDFLTRECLDYYRMLVRLAPESMKSERLEVYSVNSGAEAVENMLKYLVARHNVRSAAAGRLTGHRRFVYFDKAFHGRTVFALSVTQTIDPVATKDFVGLTTGGNIKLPFPAYRDEDSEATNEARAASVLAQLESLLQGMADEIVGIVVEPIQGAGGQRVTVPSFFRGLSQLSHRYGVALGFDEVQTGGGATGRMWAIDHFDLPHPPTALATGKKWGNGAVYMVEPLEDVGVLDSTWGGSLADMVRVVREMEIVEGEGLVARAAATGAYLAEGLRRLVAGVPYAENVRGMGLYQGFSLDTPARKGALVEAALQRHDLLLLGAGRRSIRTRPNLSATEGDVDRFLDLLGRALAEVA